MSENAPLSWNICLIREAINQIIDFRGRTPKKLNMKWGGGNIRALSANNVQMGYVDFNKECYLASEALYKKWMTKGSTAKHDVLFTMEAPLGNVALVPDDKKYILSQRVILFKVNPSIVTPYFFYQQLRSDLFQRQLKENSTGSTAVGIQQKRLVQLKLLIPPLPEQKKIAAILTSVDTVIEKTQAQINKLKDLKTGMMQELLTKGIGHTEFKDSPVGRIPVEWDCVKMNTIAKVTDGAHHTPNYTPTGVPFLRVTDLKNKNIFDGNIKYIHQSEHIELLKRCKPEKGDILYSKNGTIGITRLIDWEEEFSIFVSLALIKRLSEQISSEYLVLFMDSPIIHEQIRTRSKQGTVTNLHLEEIRDFDIPVPEQKEQLKISQVLNSLVVRLKLAEEKLLIHKNTKKALMQDLLTGKVRVKV